MSDARETHPGGPSVKAAGGPRSRIAKARWLPVALAAATLVACGGGGGGGGGGAVFPGIAGLPTAPPSPGEPPPAPAPGGSPPVSPPPSEPGGETPVPTKPQYEVLPSVWNGDRDAYLPSRAAFLNLLNEQGAKGAVRMGRLSDPQKTLFVNPHSIDDKYSFQEFTLVFSGRDGWDQASTELLQKLHDEGAKGYVLHAFLGETQTLDDSLNAIRKASFILVKNETHPATYTYRKFNFNQMRPSDFVAQVNAWGQEGYRYLNSEIGLSPSMNALAVKSSAAAGAAYTYAFDPVVSDPKPQLTSRAEAGYRYKGYVEYFANPGGQPIQGVFNLYELDSSRASAIAYRFSDTFPGGPPDSTTPEGLAVVNEQAKQGFLFTGLRIPTGTSGGAAMFFADFGIYVQGPLLSNLNAGGATLFPG